VEYGRATGARVNWTKSFLLHVGNPNIIILQVQVVTEEKPYAHLGIPVGVYCEDLDISMGSGHVQWTLGCGCGPPARNNHNSGAHIY